jgi:methylmalonyl-CoA/ethylmalonyl-CoA epimerase
MDQQSEIRIKGGPVMGKPVAVARSWDITTPAMGKNLFNDDKFAAVHDNIKRIDHIAIAVNDIDQTLKFMTGALGGILQERRETQGRLTAMESAVVRFGDFTFVILQGLHPESQISRFVDRHGPGVQHIAIEVFDIESVVRFLDGCGMRFRTELYDCGKLKQIFTERDADTMMFEFIERVDSDTFDERNIQRLYEDLERGDLV